MEEAEFYLGLEEWEEYFLRGEGLAVHCDTAMGEMVGNGLSEKKRWG